ncbi:hypothetical protein [Kribbella endophytica]
MDDWERAEAIAAEARAEIDPAVRRMRRWMRLEQVDDYEFLELPWPIPRRNEQYLAIRTDRESDADYPNLTRHIARTPGYSWRLGRKTGGEISAAVSVTLVVAPDGRAELRSGKQSGPATPAYWQELTEEVLVAPAVRIRRLFTLPLHLFVSGMGFVTVSLVPILLIVGLILLLTRCG